MIAPKGGAMLADEDVRQLMKKALEDTAPIAERAELRFERLGADRGVAIVNKIDYEDPETKSQAWVGVFIVVSESEEGVQTILERAQGGMS
jgi:hypothetical protein